MEYGQIHVNVALFGGTRHQKITGHDVNANAKKDVPRPDSPRLSSSESTAPRNISSDASLQSSVIETPYGVVRQSSSGLEPVRLHSGTSQEIFRHEMSMHKLMSMPAINEADTSSEEEEGDNERKTPKKRKGKKPKVKTGSGSMKTHPHFIEEKDEIEEEIPPVKPPPRKGIKHFFRGLCSCTKEKKYDRSGALLKVDENV